jgi:hypothetical protein
MTEAEWLEGDWWNSKVHHAAEFISNRKARLVLVAVLQRLAAIVPDQMRLSLATIERIADGLLSRGELHLFRESFRREAFFDGGFVGYISTPDYQRYYARIARKILGFACGRNVASSLPHVLKHARDLEVSLTVKQPLEPDPEPYLQEEERILEKQVETLKDIIGNPFRHVTMDPRWLTSTVVDLATTIYDHRAYERMPLLADALMDTGCDKEEIIAHCRGEGPHVRGCWVVDLLLGKE